MIREKYTGDFWNTSNILVSNVATGYTSVGFTIIC